MLSSRAYLGEIHFGNLVNPRAHQALVDRDLFNRVQGMKIPRGRQPSSDRLLARLKVLRCGSCGTPLGTMKLPRQDNYPIYRCGSNNDCAHHVTISAEIAERVVTDAVRRALSNAEERASIADSAQEAVSGLEDAQARLDSALRAFAAAGAENESVAVERLTELRAIRDEAQSRVDQIGPEATRTVNADVDWDLLNHEEQRSLIRATVKSAIVAPSGRGAERVTVHLLGE